MTREMMIKDFSHLAEFLNDMELTASVEGIENGLPTLVVTFQFEEDEEVCEESIVCNYIPLPEEDLEFSKLLQLYLRIPVDLSIIPEGYLVVLANQLNLLTAVGHFVTRAAGESQGAYLAMRHVIPFPEDELPDEGVFAETILIMMQYCQIAEGMVTQLVEGKTFEEIMLQIPIGHELREP